MPQFLFELLSGPGFLGTPAPLFSDLVVAALALVLPLLVFGVARARRGDHVTHGRIMVGTYGVLLAVVIGFVIWNQKGGPPAAPRLEQAWFYSSLFKPLLSLHIVAALTSLIIAPLTAWIGIGALTDEARWRVPGWLKMRHAPLGRLTFALLFFTAASGCVVYTMRYLV